jgi:hypothetical protein
MRLLHAGIDTSVIALWLGHESVDTTQIYLHADLQIKEKALARTRPPGARGEPLQQPIRADQAGPLRPGLGNQPGSELLVHPVDFRSCRALGLWGWVVVSVMWCLL